MLQPNQPERAQRRDEKSGKRYWAERYLRPSSETVAGETRMVYTITPRQSRPISEGESFESAVADSIAFLPEADRADKASDRIHLAGCGKHLHAGRWFNMTIDEYPDSSSVTVAYHYQTVPE